MFSGVVDECEVNQGTEGLRLEVSGRGMAALLLDNEALGQDYGTATLEDILRDHVAPYGIELAGEASLPAVSPFSVPTGSSEWAVLYEFAQYCGGVCPRFDRAGRLVLEGWTEVENLAISDAHTGDQPDGPRPAVRGALPDPGAGQGAPDGGAGGGH